MKQAFTFTWQEIADLCLEKAIRDGKLKFKGLKQVRNQISSDANSVVISIISITDIPLGSRVDIDMRDYNID